MIATLDCDFAKSKLHPINIYLFKANNKNTRAQCEICSKLKIKTPERHN